jgi:bamHI control element
MKSGMLTKRRIAMDIYKIFANNVKKNRLKQSLSQEELAFKAGLHRTYISDIEREKRSISLGNIQKISIALEIEPYELFLKEDAEND